MSKWIGMTIAPAVTGRFRSLEGRALGMSSSVMLPESAKLRLLELGSSFVNALAEQRQPMTGLMSLASRASASSTGRTAVKASSETRC
jgi:hypothetical protein